MIITGKKFSKPALSRVINGDTTTAAEVVAPEKFRLDHLLVELHPEYRRASLQTFIKSGFVKVNGGAVTKPNAKFEKSAQIELVVPEAKMPTLTPSVIFEDANVLVLNKPAGLLSMAKGEYCPESTLEDYGLLVHRLDRDTSGVVILAKNPATQKMLRKQFQDRKTKKTYVALVEGEPKLPEALIDLPIARNLKRPTTFIVDQNGKASQTYYHVLRTNGKISLLELKPRTGRTHQLRVHLKHLGIPIVGDVVYGEWTQEAGSVLDFHKRIAPRLFLHAKSLEITIPGPAGGIRKTFTAEPPAEFKNVF